MGRLPTRNEDGEQRRGSKSTDEHRLPDNFEEWRHRPDLCLMWAAFCAPSSTLTLADGVLLAKTRKSSSQVLRLLAGAGSAYELEDDSQQTEHPSSPSKVQAKADDFNTRVQQRSVNGEPSRWASHPVASGRGETARNGEARGDAKSANSPRPDEAPLAAAGMGLALPKNTLEAVGVLDTVSDSNSDNSTVEHFRHSVEVDFQPWVVGEFTQVARLAKSVHAEVRYMDRTDGTSVVVKVVPTVDVEKSKVRDGSERAAWMKNSEIPIVEDLWNEIAVLTFLQRQKALEQCKFLSRMLGLFQDDASTYLVTEYCDGGDLFERVAYGDAMAEGDKKRCISQLLQAVQHLHRHNVGHRDISLENVLLREGSCVLMDFGQAVRLQADDGTTLRYYAEAGKRMYRAPEMYVPRERPVNVVCPSDGTPGAVAQVSYDKCRCEVLLPTTAVPGKPCAAEPHGYAAAPADIFACGVCAFVLLVGKPPWNVARDMDPTFSFIRRHGIPMLLHQWRGGGNNRPGSPPADDEHLLAMMLRMNPVQRAGTDECLDSPWLDSVAPPRTRTQSAPAKVNS